MYSLHLNGIVKQKKKTRKKMREVPFGSKLCPFSVYEYNLVTFALDTKTEFPGRLNIKKIVQTLNLQTIALSFDTKFEFTISKQLD